MNVIETIRTLYHFDDEDKGIELDPKETVIEIQWADRFEGTKVKAWHFVLRAGRQLESGLLLVYPDDSKWLYLLDD